MAAETIDFNALLSEGDSMFDRSFRIVAVRHPDEAPFTVANPPTRFRAQLSAGWISGAGVNRIFGGYIMALSVKVLQALSGSQGYPDVVSAGFDFYSSGPGGAIVELRVAEKRRGRQYLYFDGELRVLNQKLANNLASLDDPDVEEKAGPWKQMTTVLGIRGVFGQLPDRDESRHLLADRLKPPTLPPREQCVDLYNSVTYRALGGDEIDYSVFPVKPANPTLRQTMRIYGDPVSIRKTIDVALQSHAQETGIPLNDGGHYVFHSDFRPHDAASVMYSSDMIPFEHLALSLKDMETTGECYLGTSLSLQLQFYARPSSSILRRMIIGGAHVSFDKAGLADSEVLLWDDRTEQLVAAGRQTLHMTRFPIAALDSLRMTQTKKGSGTGKGEVRIGNANGGVASRL